MRGLRCPVATEDWRLLRVLFLWLGPLSTDPVGTVLLPRAAEVMITSLSPAVVSARPCARCDTHGGDWARGKSALLIWCLPAVLALVSALMGGTYRLVVWPVALSWMGAACLLNARNCKRLHCYFTGPYFLLLALLGVLQDISVIRLGWFGWPILTGAFIVGGISLTYIPERLYGHYRKVE